MNYALQHVDSDVCLVTYKVLVSYINHAPSTTSTQSSSMIHPDANVEPLVHPRPLAPQEPTIARSGGTYPPARCLQVQAAHGTRGVAGCGIVPGLRHRLGRRVGVVRDAIETTPTNVASNILVKMNQMQNYPMKITTYPLVTTKPKFKLNKAVCSIPTTSSKRFPTQPTYKRCINSLTPIQPIIPASQNPS